jgi:DNA-3-methyladenine glycosylase I
MKENHVPVRCRWAQSDPLMQAHHDAEWGVAQHDSRMLWEMLMLEGFQAGLSWITVLRKREAFRKAFAGFDPALVARFNEQDIERLMLDAGIIRARAKIEATIRWAQIYLEMQKQGESFAAFRADIQIDEAPRLQVCRLHHRVCLDAGGGHCQ